MLSAVQGVIFSSLSLAWHDCTERTSNMWIALRPCSGT